MAGHQSKESLARARKRYYAKHPEAYMLEGARTRAKRKAMACDLTLADINVPGKCPVLDIPLVFSRKQCDNSPSLDRIDNAKGYTRDNVRVISWRANCLKRDATVEELAAVLAYMVRHAMTEHPL